MPPKQKITKEMILKAGYDLVLENGIGQVNSRNIAKVIGCSTQPVFSYFSTMEELRMAVHIYACEKFEGEVLDSKESSDFTKASYIKVVELAREKPNVFHLIYLSKYCGDPNLLNVRLQYKSNQIIFDEIQKKYNLSEKASKNILERMSIFVQGIATFIATSNIKYSNETVIDMVERTMDDMASGWSR